MWYFKSERLTMFNVLLAHVVHRRYSHYSRLKNNCIMYASLVYDAAEQYAGNANTGNNNHSELGRWKGLKVTRVEPQQVTDIVLRFKRVLALLQFSSVSLCSCSNYSH